MITKPSEPQIDKLPECLSKQRKTNKIYYTSNNAQISKETDNLINMLNNKVKEN